MNGRRAKDEESSRAVACSAASNGELAPARHYRPFAVRSPRRAALAVIPLPAAIFNPTKWGYRGGFIISYLPPPYLDRRIYPQFRPTRDATISRPDPPCPRDNGV
jgi:hypothetical protein